MMTFGGITSAADGPTLVVSGAVTWLILAGTLATALVAIATAWRKVISPMLKVGASISESFPIWVEIASKFHTPEGQETLSTELQALVANQQIATANQQAMIAQLETVIAHGQTLDARVSAIDVKLSETRHNIIGQFATLKMSTDGATNLVEAIVKTSEDLRHVRAELAALKGDPGVE